MHHDSDELKAYIRNWLQKAENDLTLAKDERYLKEENHVTDGICFHCQQAAEKYLKAYLVSSGIDFGKTHNLEFILIKCVTIDRDFEQLDVGNLTYYGVTVRYPDDFYMPTLDEADKAIIIAENVKAFVRSRIKLD